LANIQPQQEAQRLHSPPLQGRGRGGGISAGFLAELNSRAADMRRNPTEPEKRLWRAPSKTQLAGHKFRRQAVIGPYVADFLCPAKALIIEVDGHTHDAEADNQRDQTLETQGFRVLRVTNRDVMDNLDGVLQAIAGALAQASDRWARPHPNPSPEGDGLCDERN
jgi:very-short-patch-repair endonuclease